MGIRETSIKWTRVLVDICTQRDFLDAGAILQISSPDLVLANLRRVFDWARTTNIGVVSCVESHRPTELVSGFPLHCIDGTPGQQKLAFTLLEPRCIVEADNVLSLPHDLCGQYRQLIFRKRSRDILGNPKADRFLTQLEVSEFILCGVGLERAIRGLALGLLARNKPVTVVTDACGTWIPADGDLAARQLAAKGIRMVTTEELTAPPVPVPSRRLKGRVRTVRNRHHPARRNYVSRADANPVERK